MNAIDVELSLDAAIRSNVASSMSEDLTLNLVGMFVDQGSSKYIPNQVNRIKFPIG